MPVPEIPHALRPLGFLIGEWRGEGRGLWAAPTPFHYRELTSFACDGRPFLRYEQRASLPDGTPSHVELGYLQVGADGRLHWLVVQPTGIAEVLSGVVEDDALTAETVDVARTVLAKPVTGVRRSLALRDGVLRSLVEVSMNEEPLAPHLEAELRRA